MLAVTWLVLCCLTLLGQRCAQSGLYDPLSTPCEQPPHLRPGSGTISKVQVGRGTSVSVRVSMLSVVAAVWGVSSASSANQTVDAAATANRTCSSCKISANQVAKNPRPVELLGRGKGRMMGMSESEWEDRLALAALARIMYIYGFGSDLAAQCVMSRVRDEPDSMLLNEWGFYFVRCWVSLPRSVLRYPHGVLCFQLPEA